MVWSLKKCMTICSDTPNALKGNDLVRNTQAYKWESLNETQYNQVLVI
jgi:hypothetical protein